MAQIDPNTEQPVAPTVHSLRIHTFGARNEEIFVENVLFIGSKIHAVQELIAMDPAEFAHPTSS